MGKRTAFKPEHESGQIFNLHKPFASESGCKSSDKRHIFQRRIRHSEEGNEIIINLLQARIYEARITTERSHIFNWN
jgi:hypothetical protein